MHRHVSGQGQRAASVTAATCAVLGLGAGVGHAQPATDVRQAAEQRISTLYAQAEAATQRYDAADERIGQLQAAIDSANSQSAQTRQMLEMFDGGLGRLAAQQYRNSEYSSALSLLFATHPDDYLQRASMTNRVAALDDQQIRQAAQAQRVLEALSELGAQEMQQLQATQTQLASARTTIQGELAQARQQLAELDAADRRAVSYALDQGAAGGDLGIPFAGQAPSLGTLLSSVTSDAASAGQGQSFDAGRAQKAIEAAYSELGKPYVWGAVGPDGFDCSGLMQHSWSQAGVMLPRTSQEQANAGRSVPLSAIQPGDLVVYFPGRTHVGMYVGDGMIIHAPRPGSAVRFAPVTSMPINTIVRPD